MQSTSHGFAIAMPLLMADGWQTVVYLEEEMPGIVTLRDRGKLSSTLSLHGLNRDNNSLRATLTTAMRNFGVLEDEKGFYKRLDLPVDAKDIHLFGCFLSSISHLTWQEQKEIVPQTTSWVRVARAIQSSRIKMEENLRYTTPHQTIAVELSAVGEYQSALFQTFDQRNRVNQHMELWAHRMKTISNAHGDKVLTALVYNEEAHPDTAILSLAGSLCSLVCPSDREDEIQGLLRSVA